MSGWTGAAYLVAIALVIVGLKRLSSPATALSGNRIAAAGLLLAVGIALATVPAGILWIVLVALVAGSTAGAIGARAVRMTQMPQMVALLNGLGGGAAALVSVAEFLRGGHLSAGIAVEPATMLNLLAGALIGAVAFTGSLVAFGKLQGWVSEAPLVFPFHRAVHAALALGLVGLGALAAAGGGATSFLLFVLVALAFGTLMVLPIGGADMPVVISLLNSCTGLAAAATGFVLANPILIVGGTVVGASGALLTQLMCRAMNRSLANVLFGTFGAAPGPAGGATGAATAGTRAAGGATGAAGAHAPVREIGVEDAAVLLGNVRSVVIVPGYGMAVAQAQHATRELADLIARRGVDVKYGIHPVAGRMPGHMNVLLAEANVPYPQLYDLEQINPEFDKTDVALVIGANDVVNPAARHDPASPIYGMPILDADRARHVVILKRSLNPGFAGIDNELYYDPRTLMLFGDARQSLTRLVEALKDGAR